MTFLPPIYDGPRRKEKKGQGLAIAPSPRVPRHRALVPYEDKTGCALHRPARLLAVATAAAICPFAATAQLPSSSTISRCARLVEGRVSLLLGAAPLSIFHAPA